MRSKPVLRRIDSPIGPLWLAVTEVGLAVLSINPSGGADDVHRQLRRRDLADKPGDLAVTQQVCHQLQQYFAGELTAFSLPVDLRATPVFTERVLQQLRSIAFGQTLTYGELARAVGKPGASRAVGQANGRNPVPIILPCHRVVAANGLGGFSCGLPVKRWLLGHEGLTGSF